MKTIKRHRFKSTTIVINKEKTAMGILSVACFLIAFIITRTNLIPTKFYLDAIGMSFSSFNQENRYKKPTGINYYKILYDNMPIICANEEMQKKYDAMFLKSVKAKKEKNKKEAKKLSEKVLEVNSSGGMSVNNATDYDIDLNSLLAKDFKIEKSKSNPKILIISTHSSEAYSDTSDGRSDDENKNVIKVASVLCEELNKEGIKTIHDKTRNDEPSYNGSYKKALSVIESNLKKYPSIEIVIDVHRDYMENRDGVKLKPTAYLKEGKAAQIMFVIGTDALGLEHPNWRENLSLAAKIQKKINSNTSELCRSINVRTERFNQHATRGSMIVEVGSSENTLAEAITSARILGKAIAQVLN